MNGIVDGAFMRCAFQAACIMAPRLGPTLSRLRLWDDEVVR